MPGRDVASSVRTWPASPISGASRPGPGASAVPGDGGARPGRCPPAPRADVVLLCVGEPDQGTPEVALAAARRATASGHSALPRPRSASPRSARPSPTSYLDRFGVTVPARTDRRHNGGIRHVAARAGGHGRHARGFCSPTPAIPATAISSGCSGGHPGGAVDATRTTNSPPHSCGLLGRRDVGMLVATPSNPTGTRVAPDELGPSSPGRPGAAAALVDEIYGELVYDSPPSHGAGSHRRRGRGQQLLEDLRHDRLASGLDGLPEWACDSEIAGTEPVHLGAGAGAVCGLVGAVHPTGWAVVGERREEERRPAGRVDGRLRASIQSPSSLRAPSTSTPGVSAFSADCAASSLAGCWTPPAWRSPPATTSGTTGHSDMSVFGTRP